MLDIPPGKFHGHLSYLRAGRLRMSQYIPGKDGLVLDWEEDGEIYSINLHHGSDGPDCLSGTLHAKTHADVSVTARRFVSGSSCLLLLEYVWDGEDCRMVAVIDPLGAS